MGDQRRDMPKVPVEIDVAAHDRRPDRIGELDEEGEEDECIILNHFPTVLRSNTFISCH